MKWIVGIVSVVLGLAIIRAWLDFRLSMKVLDSARNSTDDFTQYRSY